MLHSFVQERHFYFKWKQIVIRSNTSQKFAVFLFYSAWINNGYTTNVVKVGVLSIISFGTFV